MDFILFLYYKNGNEKYGYNVYFDSLYIITEFPLKNISKLRKLDHREMFSCWYFPWGKDVVKFINIELLMCGIVLKPSKN